MAESLVSDYLTAQSGGGLVEQIRDAILRGELTPATQLKEQMLAERFGVSRTPIRQALTQLVGEGVVVRLPRVGFFVRKLRRQECIELLELRRELEALAASLAAKRITPDQADELEALAQAVDEMQGKPVTAEVRAAELRFHRRVVELAGNGELSRVLGQLQVVYLTLSPHWVNPAILDNQHQAVRFSHVDAAQAIASGDRQKAHDVMWAQFDPTMTELHGGSE